MSAKAYEKGSYALKAPYFSFNQLLTPGNLILFTFYALTVTVAPIYLLYSLDNALKSKERTCDYGAIIKIRNESPHITIQTPKKKVALTLPSDPLSIKKRIFGNQYQLIAGQQLSFCTIHYAPFDQNFLMELRTNQESLLDEVTAKQIIKEETGISSLVSVNVLSYLCLLCYAIKFRRKT